jgi:hypothetical protein
MGDTDSVEPHPVLNINRHKDRREDRISDGKRERRRCFRYVELSM